MTEAEVEKAVAAAIEETGRLLDPRHGQGHGALKARHTGKMDFARAGAAIKQAFR